MGNIMIKFHKVYEGARIPTRGSDGAAGFDLYSMDRRIIPARGSVSFKTGITTEFNPNVGGFIWPRSGLAFKYSIDVQGGVIDSDYRGEIMVSLINHGAVEYQVEIGDRIAQIVFMPILTEAAEAESYLSETDRGSSGFGDSGK